MAFTVRVVRLLGCCLLPGIVLLVCGFFSPYWVDYKINNITCDCFRGVVYNSDCPDDISDLGETIQGLLATSLFIITITTIVWVYLFVISLRGKNEDTGNNYAGCRALICFYLCAGIFGFSGCMVVIADFGDHTKGWAFYISLVASCILVLQAFPCCCVICMNDKKGGNHTGKDIGQKHVNSTIDSNMSDQKWQTAEHNGVETSRQQITQNGANPNLNLTFKTPGAELTQLTNSKQQYGVVIKQEMHFQVQEVYQSNFVHLKSRERVTMQELFHVC